MMRTIENRRRNVIDVLFVRMAPAILVVVLASCSTPDSTGRLLVAPGKFVLYSCAELAARARQNAQREQKLRDLMAKAESGPGGHMASTLAYRPEYDSLLEESRQLKAMQVEKNCGTSGATAPPASERANRNPVR